MHPAYRPRPLFIHFSTRASQFELDPIYLRYVSIHPHPPLQVNHPALLPPEEGPINVPASQVIWTFGGSLWLILELPPRSTTADSIHGVEDRVRADPL